MGKRKLGALDKLEADLYISPCLNEVFVTLTNGFRFSLQCQIRRDPMYVRKKSLTPVADLS